MQYWTSCHGHDCVCTENAQMFVNNNNFCSRKIAPPPVADPYSGAPGARHRGHAATCNSGDHRESDYAVSEDT